MALGESAYDPGWVVELAKTQYPEDAWLHSALDSCTVVARYCECGCGTPYFVNMDPDAMGEDSEFGMRITLVRDSGTPVVVDLLPDGRVACIEG